MSGDFTRSAALACTLAMLLSGCSGDWFGFRSAPPTTLEPQGGYAPARVDTRPLVARVTALSAEPAPGGLILRAVGEARTGGYWDPDLVRVSDDESEAETGERVYEFRVRPPITPPEPGPPAARRIDAGAFASDRALTDVRRIIVTAAENSRSIRR